MASPAQITANRANAQRSTGPRSVEGKSASRMNALKHGIDAETLVIPGEDPAEYEALAEAYEKDYAPDGASEDFHVETMLRAAWQKRRLERVEAEATRMLLNENPGQSLAVALLTDTPVAKLLARTQRQIAAHQRAWYRAHSELVRERRLSGSAEDAAFNRYLDRLCARPTPDDSPENDDSQNDRNEPNSTPAPPPQRPAKSWPPVDENTGKPLYFVG